MTRVKRGLVYVLAAVMMTSSMDMTVYATEKNIAGQEIMVSAEAVNTYAAGEMVDSGSCGENLTWTLTGLDGDYLELTISGEGEMDSMADFSAPWYSYRLQIQQVTISEGVTSIGDVAFIDCSSLTNVTIPDSVMSIGKGAFAYCSSLTSVTIPEGVTSIWGGAFVNCSELTSVTLPKSLVNLYGGADDGIFYRCSKLKTAGSIGGGYNIEFAWDERIPKSAFQGCDTLASVTIPDGVTSIGDSAFSECYILKNVMIPKSVKSIEGSAFFGSQQLRSITIPEGVTSIGEWAFSDCICLGSVMISDSVTSIGENAFSSCEALDSVFYTGMEEDWIKIQIADGNDKLLSAERHYGWHYSTGTTDGGDIAGGHINNGTEQGVDWVIDAERKLKVTGTGNFKEEGSKYPAWYGYRGDIESAVIDLKGCTDASNMFSLCALMQTVDVSKFDTSTVTNMRNMFYDCEKLEELDMSGFHTQEVTDMSGMFYKCSALQSLNLSSFQTDKVAEMTGMFRECGALRSIVFHNFNTENVTSMQMMFGGCVSLQDLDVSKFNTGRVTDMSEMFVACSKLKALDLTAFDTSCVTDMRRMFSGCRGLESLDVSSFATQNVTNMANMFFNCSGLKSLDLSNFDMSGIEQGEFDTYDPWTNSSIPENCALYMLEGCNLERIEAPIHVGDKIIIWFSDHYAATSDEGYSWYRTDTNKRIINLPTGLTKSVTLLRRDGAAFTDTLVVKQKADITDRFAATMPYNKYTVTPKGAASITSKGILTAKKPAETVTITGLVKDGKVWKEAESITFKIEAPAIVQKTITATKPDMTINAADNISGTTISPSSWSSSKPAVAEIDAQTGVITTKTKGTTKITAVYGEGKDAAQYTFNIKVNIPVMSKTRITVLTGATLKLNLKNVPKDRTSEIKWASSDKQVAEVDSTGKVSILSYDEKMGGKVTITATIDGVPYACEIAVKKPEIKKSNLVIKQGKSGKVALKNTKLKNIMWSSSDEKIATVDDKGKVVGVAPGTVIIQATAGGVTNTCEVTVK